MNANEMTYGVELEVMLPATHVMPVGAYHAGVQIAGLPSGWNAQRDGSLRPDPGYYGVEIVSPVLRGAEGLKQIVEVCKWLQSIGAKVNRSTGCHVHVGFRGGNTELAVLTGLVAYHETALFAVTGTKSRMASMYCKPVRNSNGHKETAKKLGSRPAADRYHTLNLANLNSGRRQTVEFRCFAGTTNELKVVGYVRMCLALVEKSHEMKRLPKWIPANDSKGSDAVVRFFACFGWTKGKTKVVSGNVVADDVPSFDACKSKLLQMARKFDKSTAE